MKDVLEQGTFSLIWDDKKSLSGESDWLMHHPRLGFLGFWGQKAQMGCRNDKHHARARSLRRLLKWLKRAEWQQECWQR
jgi:hypothetical protein